MGKKSKAPGWAIRRAIKRNAKNCASKVRYKSIDDAAAFARDVQKGNQMVYICQVCGEYHLTTVKKKDRFDTPT